MSMLSSERLATERASFPEAGPFVPVQGDSKAGNEMWRAVLTSLLASIPCWRRSLSRWSACR